jgi:hypothetical protein
MFGHLLVLISISTQVYWSGKRRANKEEQTTATARRQYKERERWLIVACFSQWYAAGVEGSEKIGKIDGVWT